MTHLALQEWLLVDNKASSRKQRENLRSLRGDWGGSALLLLHETRPPVLTVVLEQQQGPWPEERLPRTSLPCGGGTGPTWNPQVLLYSSTHELQTLAALRLRVAMLDQQIHLEKVFPE